MLIAVELESQLRIQAGTGSVELQLPASCSVCDALDLLQQQIGQIQAGGLLIFRNGHPVPTSLAQKTPLSNGDRLLLLPAIAGG